MDRTVTLRAARQSDALDLTCLLDSASHGLAVWSWTKMREPGQSVIEVGRGRIRNNEASPLYYKVWTIAEVEGNVAGALAGRLIPNPYQRDDAGALSDVFVPLVEL